MENKFTVEYLGQPYTYENSENPWIMDTKVLKDDVIIGPDNVPMTAEYLWSLNTKERINALKFAFEYFRKNGFPYPIIKQDQIKNNLKKLYSSKPNSIIREDGLISNSINVAMDLGQFIAQEEYFSAKGESPNSKSLIEIFNDDDALIKVLKNRMGWNTSKEDGVERPYLFPVSHEQIRRGIRNSGLGYSVSNFRPSIAKFIYNRYVPYMSNVFDYSCGWGTRMLAALGNVNYYGTDPLTADKITNWVNEQRQIIPEYFNTIVECNKCGSEIFIEDYVDKMDMCMSCPPYFTLERYCEDETQSYNKFSDYILWLSDYWRPTVLNCRRYLKKDGYFVLIIKDSFKKYNLKEDMVGIIKDCNFNFVEEFAIFNTKNHLTGKAKSKNTTKNNEYIIVFKKNG